MFDGTLHLNPMMFRLLKNRSDGGRGFWVCKRADGNTDQRRQIVGFPIDRRPAIWTKIAMDLPAASGVADELFWSSRDGDDLGGIKSAYPEWRAGSSLAVDAVTGDNQLGW